MRKIILVLLTLFVCSLSNGQSGEIQKSEKIKKQCRDFTFAPGLIVQHETFLEFNVMFGDVTHINGKIPIIGIEGFRIGVETNLRDGRNHTIAPKVGYEVSMTLFSIRLSAVNYFQNGSSEFRLLPELGLSIGGKINLMYGYGIPFNNGNLNNVSCHRVGLSFNFNERLNNAVF
jgi:hypothetical protein